jgi:hypothetical protein
MALTTSFILVFFSCAIRSAVWDQVINVEPCFKRTLTDAGRFFKNAISLIKSPGFTCRRIYWFISLSLSLVHIHAKIGML